MLYNDGVKPKPVLRTDIQEIIDGKFTHSISCQFYYLLYMCKIGIHTFTDIKGEITYIIY